MPASNGFVVGLRRGHIDLENGTMGDVGVALSLEPRVTEDGEPVVMLHIDVARGGDIDAPFSVGIPLREIDADHLLVGIAEVFLTSVEPDAEPDNESDSRIPDAFRNAFRPDGQVH